MWLLIAFHAGVLAYAATANSVTFDEYNMLASGAWYWRFGRFLTPPLLRLWMAAPALLAGAHVPPIDPLLWMEPRAMYWKYAEVFMRANAADYHHLFVLARCAMIPISCFGA